MNAVLVRVHKDTGEFELFAGAGFSALLGSDGVAQLHKNVAGHLPTAAGMMGRETLIARALLVQIESPLLQQEGSPLGATKLEVSPDAKTPIPRVADPASFGRGAGIVVLLLLFSIGSAAVYRMLYTEIHLGARAEKRVSPYYGKWRRANLSRDLITGGGVSGFWNR